MDSNSMDSNSMDSNSMDSNNMDSNSMDSNSMDSCTSRGEERTTAEGYNHRVVALILHIFNIWTGCIFIRMPSLSGMRTHLLHCEITYMGMRVFFDICVYTGVHKIINACTPALTFECMHISCISVLLDMSTRTHMHMLLCSIAHVSAYPNLGQKRWWENAHECTCPFGLMLLGWHADESWTATLFNSQRNRLT